MVSFAVMSDNECYDIDGGAFITGAIFWGVVKTVGICFGKGLATGAGIWVSKKVLDTVFD